jgi:hypothetical protein
VKTIGENTTKTTAGFLTNPPAESPSPKFVRRSLAGGGSPIKHNPGLIQKGFYLDIANGGQKTTGEKHIFAESFRADWVSPPKMSGATGWSQTGGFSFRRIKVYEQFLIPTAPEV